MQARRSVLIHEDNPWVKKEGDSFDVTMGSFDGAEICELIGLFILSLLSHIRGSAGLYRDDGLMALRGSPRQIELKKKEICKILKETGIDITIEANRKIVNMLDLTLDLNTGTYQTFNKPNHIPLYVHRESNHPPSILKNVPLSVNKRLSLNSSNKEKFDQTSAPFQKALKDSGYDHTLNFEPKIDQTKATSKNRPRKIIWFAPPFSSNVTTRIGSKILALIDSSFPPSHDFHKIFNRNNVKVSYRTTPNMKQIIGGHNKKILSKFQSSNHTKECTCTAEPCPVDGICQQEGTIYQATVSHKDTNTNEELKETYIGMTGPPFIERYRNHRSSFKLKHKETDSELSKHIWNLKGKGLTYQIKWKILDRTKTFSPISRICKLCTLERFYLITRKDLYSLNKNTEFGHDCLHKRFFKLSTAK